MPYRPQQIKNVCDKFYMPGVDFVYVPYDRLDGNLYNLVNSLNQVLIVIQDIVEDCGPALEIICHFLFPPCGNVSILEPPTSVCEEVCHYMVGLCPEKWQRAMELFEVSRSITNATGLSLINCSNTGEYLEPLPHCCSYTGVEIRMSLPYLYIIILL